MKKVTAIFLIFVLSLSLMAGCGKKEEEAPTELSVTIINSSGYIFNELYMTPTAESEWGEDHLGSTSVLKKGGSFDITLPVYDYNTYDIRVVDEDDDVYLFERVPLKDGCEVDIVWDSELAAEVSYTDGDDAYITGVFESSGGEYEDDPIPEWLEMVFYNNTDWDFTEIYIYESGSADYGYNHVANGPLYSFSESAIGVDYYDYYDIQMIDSDSDMWVFEGVSLEADCYVEINLADGNAQILIATVDGSVDEYGGIIY